MQDFHVVRCYSCSKFQVHIVRKDCKFSCKVCNEKQSVKKNYGRGSAKDCRNHVQKLNKILIASEQAPFAALDGNFNYSSNQQNYFHEGSELYEDAEVQQTECSFSDDYVDKCGINLYSDEQDKYSEHKDYNVVKDSDFLHSSELNCNNVSSNISQSNSPVNSTPSEGSSTKIGDRSDFKHRLDESVNIPLSSGITEIDHREEFPQLPSCLSGCNSLKESKTSTYYSDPETAAQPSAKRKFSGSFASECLYFKTINPHKKEMDTLQTASSKKRMLSKLSYFDDLDI